MNREPMRVLLVEDNAGDARLLREALAEVDSGGFKLIHVDRLETALSRLDEEEYSLALVDLSLPDAHGLDSVTQVHARAPRVPIIVLTGLNDEAVAIRALREGAQDYLFKGQVDGNLLVRAMRYAIERQHAEEALRGSEERYRLLFNNANDALFVHTLGEDGTPLRFVEVNDAACSMLGYSREELLNLSPHDLDTPEFAREQPRIRQAVQEGGSFLFETELITKDRSRIPVELSGHLFEYKGQPMVLATARDITDRKRAEEEKRLLQEQLAHAQKMEAVGTLAGGIAHEFNNINAVIMGYIDLTLQTDNLPESIQRNLEIVRTSAVRGGELTKSLLAFSRKDVGQRRPISLRDVVDEVPLVMGDFGLMTHVVINLVINARHAMLKSPVKRLTIETGVDKNKPFIRVRDTGCGIPKDDISRVFEPFFTTKGSLASGQVFDQKARGTGLGLSVSHSIVQGHGGEITVSSGLNKGTTFTVYLPAAEERRTHRQNIELKRRDGAPRIIIVDDEKDITNLLVQVLNHAGYAADGFTNAREALDVLQRDHYRLAFVDLQMPDMTGHDFMEELNRLPDKKKPLKVILTGRLDHPHEDYARLDVFATLHKPFSHREVLQIVEKGVAAGEQPGDGARN
jgi:two-component system cell cycle sensor histidine kinase/response regulator CckA